MKEGFYEQVITRSLEVELRKLEGYLVQREQLGKANGSVFIARFLQIIINQAFQQLGGRHGANSNEDIIGLANALIIEIANHLNDPEYRDELIEKPGEFLHACFRKAFFAEVDLQSHIKAVIPFTGLSESELFTGSKTGISLDSELRKEMLTADQVWWLVSFVKFEGVRLFEQVLKELEEKGKSVRIICTVYMGATDIKAIDFLSRFSNIEIKISYNIRHERLHAKSYLFLRESGFHTGYIGSSNMSRSALTSGLEWNLKVTQQEIPHIITKCRSTFETYWNDPNFELYNVELHRDKLVRALKSVNLKSEDDSITKFFDILPFPFQQEILEQLVHRRSKGENHNLIVAATGTGKTVIAAFDFKAYLKQNPQSSFLFVAHREEILKQARYTFRQILRNNDFGELWYGGKEPQSLRHVFVSIQTLNNRIENMQLAPEFYDYVVIDEVHHSSASSYQKIFQFFSPKLLVGLTATPERHDGEDIIKYFGNRISAEIRLPEALNRGLLCPFQYFGITDSVDISAVSWRRGRYVVEELEKLYGEDQRRVSEILRNCDKYLKDAHEVRALGYCVSKKHARFMADSFVKKGLRAAHLTSDNSEERNSLMQQLRSKEINYLFVVDMFNEGVDIPEVDTLLFLRPTESLTIFLQQLGRGLRLHEDKDCLTVLDFVGQQHAEYSFEHKFRGMLGKTHTRIKEEIENDFPHLPLGCSITLEKTAKEIILQNITRAYRGGRQAILHAIARFRQDYAIPLTLRNFCEYLDIGIHKVYGTKSLWYQLTTPEESNQTGQNQLQQRLVSVLGNTWLATESSSYFGFIRGLIESRECDLTLPEHQQMLLMLYIDIFDETPPFDSYDTALMAILEVFTDRYIASELSEYLDFRLSQITCLEKPFLAHFPSALRLHGRYTRNQILAGLSESTLQRKASSREGVYRIASKNLELLFVTLDKSEGNFNPSTMYHDYFISEELFHWQSQNSTSPQSATGQSYILHRKHEKQILLFIREASKDENGITMAFVFCGDLHYISHEGSKPMSITWRMLVPPPPELLNEGRKLAVG